MEEKISVVIPVYNIKEYLEECIESVLHQTYQQLEILLIDDGSTDGSTQVCESYVQKDSRIVFLSQENSGLSVVRNRGIQEAKGEYIFFLDGDDYLAKEDALENMCRHMTKDVDIVTAYCFEKRGEKKYYPIRMKYSKPERLTSRQGLELLYDWKDSKYNFIVSHNKLYRATLFEGISYPEGKSHEDEFTTYRLFLKARQIVIYNEMTYVYRKREKSIMSAYTEDRLAVLEALEERMEQFQALGYQTLVWKTKKHYLHQLLYHRLILEEKGMPQYSWVNQKYKRFLQKNPLLFFSPLRYQFWKQRKRNRVSS